MDGPGLSFAALRSGCAVPAYFRELLLFPQWTSHLITHILPHAHAFAAFTYQVACRRSGKSEVGLNGQTVFCLPLSAEIDDSVPKIPTPTRGSGFHFAPLSVLCSQSHAEPSVASENCRLRNLNFKSPYNLQT